MRKNSAVGYEKSEESEKNDGGVTGTANRYARRAGMPVTTHVWTNHLLTYNAAYEQNEPGPK